MVIMRTPPMLYRTNPHQLLIGGGETQQQFINFSSGKNYGKNFTLNWNNTHKWLDNGAINDKSAFNKTVLLTNMLWQKDVT